MVQDAGNCASATESADGIQIPPDTVAAVIDEAQGIAANDIVKNHIIASMGVSMIPVPLLDLAGLTATQINMLRSLSEHYAIEFEEGNTKSLVTALLGGSLPMLGAMGFSSMAKFVPVLGSFGGGAALSIISGAVTYAVGQTFIMHFEEGGTFEDFDPKAAQKFFKQKIESGKLFVQEMRDEINELKGGESSTTQSDNTSSDSVNKQGAATA